MLKNYIKVALRNIYRQKTYSIINITSLSIGLTCFILIIFYIQFELNFESQHEKAEQIYRVNVVQHHPNNVYRLSHSMVPLGGALKEAVPEVKDFTRLQDAGKTFIKYEDNKYYENNVKFVDQGIFNLFTIPVIQGDMATALTEKFSVVITETIAKKYFGDENPIGKNLIMDNQYTLTVTAIIEDFAENTHIDPDFMISFNTLRDLVGENFMNNWVTTRLVTYVLILDTKNLTNIERKINQVMTVNSSTEVKRSLELEQFSRIHLYSEISEYGDIQYIYLFLSIGVLILIIAAINFMNLSTARSAKRGNEVGLRKVVGAKHSQLVKQFIGESIIMSVFALVFALFLIELVLPYFSELTGQDLGYPAYSQWQFYGLLLLITLGLGLLSGSYPAFYLAAFSPLTILKGKQGAIKKDVNLRKILVVTQFSIAIALIISTLLIGKQLHFLQTKKLGFQKEQILVVPAYGGEFLENPEPFKSELLKNPNIRGVCGSMLLPSRIGMYNNVTWEGAAENESIALIQNKVDYDFLDNYEIEVIEGRNFSREHSLDLADYDRDKINGAMILNQAAVAKFGWDDPLGKMVIQTFGTKRYYFNVIGVIKDFHFASLRNSIEPLSLFLRPAYPQYFSIKIVPIDIQNTIADIRSTWNRFNSEFPFEYYFLDETFKKSYQSEEKIQQLFGHFSLLSIFISCLGLFGLAAFAAEKRVKEIGIRKTLGASMMSILLMLSKEFTKWIVIANIIAWPLAYFFMNKWLQGFAYRTDINLLTFVLVSLLTLAIALITVSYQSVKAASVNPVEAIRYE
jgi:putative ABC transport system permease protein